MLSRSRAAEIRDGNHNSQHVSSSSVSNLLRNDLRGLRMSHRVNMGSIVYYLTITEDRSDWWEAKFMDFATKYFSHLDQFPKCGQIR